MQSWVSANCKTVGHIVRHTVRHFKIEFQTSRSLNSIPGFELNELEHL